MKKRIILDIFSLFLTQGYDAKIFEMEGAITQEKIQEFIDDLYEKLPDFFFEFTLIDTLFRLRGKADVYFFSRYNSFTTNCILTRLGVNGLFDGIVTPEVYETGQYGVSEIKYHKPNNKSELVFEKIWANIE